MKQPFDKLPDISDLCIASHCRLNTGPLLTTSTNTAQCKLYLVYENCRRVSNFQVQQAGKI